MCNLIKVIILYISSIKYEQWCMQYGKILTWKELILGPKILGIRHFRYSFPFIPCIILIFLQFCPSPNRGMYYVNTMVYAREKKVGGGGRWSICTIYTPFQLAKTLERATWKVWQKSKLLTEFWNCFNFSKYRSLSHLLRLLQYSIRIKVFR